MLFCFFFFKQKTAYEMRISDWSSDVCSSDLCAPALHGRCPASRGTSRWAAAQRRYLGIPADLPWPSVLLILIFPPSRLVAPARFKIGRASCRERVCQYV